MLVAAPIAAIALASLAGSAQAAPKPKDTRAKVVGTVKIDPNDPSQAYVLAQYTCTIADPANNPGHLWVSVKQNDGGTFDPELATEGSGFGGIATRWEDSHRNPVTCDGKNHTERFAVDQLELEGLGAGTLVKGEAWVQFCLFDDTTPKGDGVTDFGQPVSSMVWVHVN
jgi:hypothetical protein